jgi:hypothetical protein
MPRPSLTRSPPTQCLRPVVGHLPHRHLPHQRADLRLVGGGGASADGAVASSVGRGTTRG